MQQPSGALLMLLIPDGRLPSPRWRPLVWLIVILGGMVGAGRTLRKLRGIAAHPEPISRVPVPPGGGTA